MGGPGPSPKQRAATAAAPGAWVPDDALVEMFGLLPVSSLHRFKCVSKAWCGLVTDPLHRQRYAQKLAGFLCLDTDAAACESCRVGVAGAESSQRTCPHATTTWCWRFVNVSGMVEPLLDASFSFLPPRPPDDDDDAFRDVILDTRHGLVLLACVRGHEGPDLHPPSCYLVCNPMSDRRGTGERRAWPSLATACSQLKRGHPAREHGGADECTGPTYT